MNPTIEFTAQPLKFNKEETLHIDQRKGTIATQLSSFRFVDKDTKQVVFYVPALNISSYGSDNESALAMVQEALTDYFLYLIELKMDDLTQELSNLGWKRNRFRGKDFSKLHVDINGELHGLNAVDDKIEKFALTAA